VLDIAPDVVGLKGSRTRVVKSERPILTRECTLINGTPSEQAEALIRGAFSPFLAGRAEVADAGTFSESAQQKSACSAVENACMAEGGLWVFCETYEGGVRDASFELIGKAAELSPAMNAPVIAAYVGTQPSDDLFGALCESGADAVLAVCDESLKNADALVLAGELEALVRKYRPAVLLLGATAFGRSLAPRLAARLNTGLTADCTALSVDLETKMLLQTRPAFGGHLMATIICPDARPQMATVRPRVFAKPRRDEKRLCRVAFEKACGASSPVTLIERIAREQGTDIGAADILVSVGQGIGNAENIALAEQLAHRLGGALSSSRPLVDAGVMPYARQVGQTGKTVSPKIYLALGISGAMQHMAGVAAKEIIAVNTDPEAPIFDYAHCGLIADCGDFLRALLEKIG
jgi:electron transfer flavoprotein alpha subunit